MGLIQTIKNIGKINKFIAKAEENKEIYEQLKNKLQSVYELLSDILESLSVIKNNLKKLNKDA